MKVENKRTYLFEKLIIHHEFDGAGHHRIRVKDKVGDTQGYTHIAQVQYRSLSLAATTEYYSGVLPRLFKVTSLEDYVVEEG